MGPDGVTEVFFTSKKRSWIRKNTTSEFEKALSLLGDLLKMFVNSLQVTGNFLSYKLLEGQD